MKKPFVIATVWIMPNDLKFDKRKSSTEEATDTVNTNTVKNKLWYEIDTPFGRFNRKFQLLFHFSGRSKANSGRKKNHKMSLGKTGEQTKKNEPLICVRCGTRTRTVLPRTHKYHFLAAGNKKINNNFSFLYIRSTDYFAYRWLSIIVFRPSVYLDAHTETGGIFFPNEI